MNDTPNSNEQRNALWELIGDVRFAMFTTRNGSGELHSRPMTTQNRNEDHDDSLWFFMSRSSDPVAELQQDPAVNVAYADPSEDSYVSVCGNAELVEDEAKKRELWNKMTEAWFPGGPSDPDVVLVRVRITSAEYWDVKSPQPVQLYKMAKAVVTGKPPTDMGHHGEVRMR